MHNRIQHLLHNDQQMDEQYIEELEARVIDLGQQVLDIAQELNESQRQILESYMDCMAELELRMIILSYNRGKEAAKNRESDPSRFP